ncbi:MAG: hypothetical protein JWP82_2510 [Humibacillus sp.]|nr:hypothetical protein [Humibacillus sp.]
MQVETGTGRPVTTPAELAAHLEQVRAHRAELRESVAAVELALETPLARQGPWLERVGVALTELAHDFGEHVALTESPGGIYDRARHTAPRLGGAVRRLLTEHRDLAAEIVRLLTVLESGAVPADLRGLREELTVLTGRLGRHRQAGGDLVYEAYDVDLGGSG